jgi:hypothetical protein
MSSEHARTRAAFQALRSLLWMPFELLKKYRSASIQFGYLNALLYGLNQVFIRILGRDVLWHYILVAQPVAQNGKLPASRGRSIEIRVLGANDSALASLPLPPEVIERRFRKGAVCLVAVKEDKTVGCIWLKLGIFDEDEVRCRFVPLPTGEAAWDFDVYVAPPQRGTVAFLRLWDSANAYLREHGIKWSMSRISAFNHISLLSHASMNAHRLGSACYLRLGRWQLMYSTLSPFVYLSSGPASVPRIALRPPGIYERNTRVDAG